MNEADRKLYQKRKIIYWAATITLAAFWYAVTGIESVQMGLHPLTRRAFTWLDLFLFSLVIVCYILIHRWHKKCPKCGRKMQGNVFSPQCSECGFGSSPEE